MRRLAALLTAAFLAAGPTAGQDKTATPAADALASLPKNGWVSAGKVKVKPWFADEGAYRLVMKFVPDKTAAGKAEPKGKVTLGFDLSKDGQAEVVLQPADGRYELIEGKSGTRLRIVREGEFPEKTNAFVKVKALYESENQVRLDGGKLTFPEGFTVAAWGSLPGDVKHAGSLTFVPK
ncbi:MAG TPA: hypothetical protein VD866_31395 [Urbifossiella sp.]|nr:hypothetical protein [Urbifossiella sp.]